MGLDDEAEKLRQAREWVTSPTATPEQAQAGTDYILYRQETD